MEASLPSGTATSLALASAAPARSMVAAMAAKRLQSPPSVTSARDSRCRGSASADASGGARAGFARARAGGDGSDGMIVGINDASHQVAAHHVGGGKADRLDATNAAQQADRLLKARALTGGQVDLAGIPGHRH